MGTVAGAGAVVGPVGKAEMAMAEVSARATVEGGKEEGGAGCQETVAATGAKVAVAVAEPAALEGKTWVCARKCRRFRNCRGFRRIGIRHCTRNGPAVPDLSRKREAPPPRPSAQAAAGIRARESPPSKCHRPCHGTRADPAVGVVGAGAAALAAAAAAAAMGELGELVAEGERIRRSRSCRSSASYRSRPLLLTAFDTCGRDARDCELPIDSSWIDSTPLSWGRPGAGLTRGVPTTAHPCRCGRRATCTRTGAGTRSLTASSVGCRLCVTALARTRARGARALAPRPLVQSPAADSALRAARSKYGTWSGR